MQETPSLASSNLESSTPSLASSVDITIEGQRFSIPVHKAVEGEFLASKGMALASERLWSAVLKLYETGLFPGISVCVYHQHQPLLHRAIGYACVGDPMAQTVSTEYRQWCEGGATPMRPEQPVCLFSASKMVMAMLIHWLADSGQLSLHEPIANYVPKLAGLSLGDLTLLDVLSHRAGVPSFPKQTPFEILLDPQIALEALAQVSPQDQIGDDFAYHALTGGVLVDAVITSVAGCDIQTLLERVIRKPLQMSVFSYGLPVDDKDRLKGSTNSTYVHEYYTGERPNLLLQQWVKRLLGASFEEVLTLTHDPRFRRSIIPAANLYARPMEMCRFLQVMAQHGCYGSTRVFSPQAVSKALEPIGGWVFDKQLMLPMRYSAGFMLGANPVGLWGPFSQSSFGHLGFANKLCWANPKTQTAVCLAPNGNCLSAATLKAVVPFVVEVQRLAGVF